MIVDAHSHSDEIYLEWESNNRVKEVGNNNCSHILSDNAIQLFNLE